VRFCPAAGTFAAPATSCYREAMGMGWSGAGRRRWTCSSSAGPGGAGGGGLRSLGGPSDTLLVESTVSAARRGLQADREIPAFGRHQAAHELTSRAVSQARKFGARTARVRAKTLEPGDGRPSYLEEGTDRGRGPCFRSTGGPKYRRLPVEHSRTRGASPSSTCGPPEAHLCGGCRVGVDRRGNSAGQASGVAGRAAERS
jgi:hypothetical protein